MKYFSYVVCLVLALATSGCFEMLEDIYLNADGTGEYQITMDMSGMFDDPFMGEMMKKGMQEQTGAEELEIDSLINFTDMQGGSLPPTLTDRDRELIGRTEVRLRMSETDKIGKIFIKFPFKDMAELNDFQDAFARVNEDSEEGGMGGMMGGSMVSNNSNWSLSGRTLNRAVNIEDSADALEEIDDETMQMMKMFLEGSSFTTTYHLPGKVKKCSIPDAVVDGKTVMVSYDMLDAIENQPDTGGTIKFKKK